VSTWERGGWWTSGAPPPATRKVAATLESRFSSHLVKILIFLPLKGQSFEIFKTTFQDNFSYPLHFSFFIVAPTSLDISNSKCVNENEDKKITTFS
jgi:hypothetical protein